MTKFEVYTLLTIDELFTSLSGDQNVSILDLPSAYQQIPLPEDSQECL